MGAGNSSLAEDICSDHILTNSLQKLEQLFFPVGEYLGSAQSPNKSHVTSEALKKFLVLKLKKKKKAFNQRKSILFVWEGPCCHLGMRGRKWN